MLARIFSGKISKWDDPAIAALNPAVKLPGTAIVPVHRASSSGSTFLFTLYLNAQDPAGWSSSLIGTTVAWPRKAGALGAVGSDAIVSRVKSAPGAIGYVGVSYLSQVMDRERGRGRAGQLLGQLRASRCPRDPGGSGQLHQHARQRDHLADQRRGRPGLPDHQLRICRSECLPAQRDPGTGPGPPSTGRSPAARRSWRRCTSSRCRRPSSRCPMRRSPGLRAEPG